MPLDAQDLFSSITDQGPGCAAAVLHKGQIVFEYYGGLANLSHRIPITASTRFPIASVSKMFTALLFGMLAQEGRLNLNTPVQYVADLGLPDTITLAHLLTMTSGLRDVPDIMPLIGSPKWESHTEEDWLAMVRRCQSLSFQTGTAFLYNNINYFLLAKVAEAIYQQDFDTILRTRVLSPLGMDNTGGWNSAHEIQPDIAQGCVPVGDAYRSSLPLFPLKGWAGLTSTLPDMIKWLHLLRKGLFAGVDLKKFWTGGPALQNGQNSWYANGAINTTVHGAPFIGHTGGLTGFIGLTAFSAEKDLGFVLLSNNDHFDCKGTAEKLLVPFGFDLSLSLPASWTPCTGLYIDPTDGEWVECIHHDTHLAIRHLQNSYKLIHAADNSLYQPWNAQCVALDAPSTPDELTLHLGGMTKKFIRQEKIEPPARRFEDYTGKYQNEEMDAMHEIFIQNGTLKIRFGHFTNASLTYDLIPTGKDSFRAEGGPPGWSAHYALLFDREHFSKMLRGYTINSARLKNVEFRRLRMF